MTTTDREKEIAMTFLIFIEKSYLPTKPGKYFRKGDGLKPLPKVKIYDREELYDLFRKSVDQ